MAYTAVSEIYYASFASIRNILFIHHDEILFQRKRQRILLCEWLASTPTSYLAQREKCATSALICRRTCRTLSMLSRALQHTHALLWVYLCKRKRCKNTSSKNEPKSHVYSCVILDILHVFLNSFLSKDLQLEKAWRSSQRQYVFWEHREVRDSI